jgi:hypothetical protein
VSGVFDNRLLGRKIVCLQGLLDHPLKAELRSDELRPRDAALRPYRVLA